MRLLLLALACAVCLVACGGDDEDPAPAGSGSGAAEESSADSGGSSEDSSADSGGGSEDWAAQVNEICARNETETQKIATKAQEELEANDARLSAEIIERTVPLQKDLLGELGDVQPPEDVGEDYDAFLARIDDGVDLLPRLAESLRSGEEDPELAAKFEEIAQDTRPFAAEHGLHACVPDAG